MQGVRIWLPNIEGLFISLVRLLESAEGERNTASYESRRYCAKFRAVPVRPVALVYQLNHFSPQLKDDHLGTIVR